MAEKTLYLVRHAQPDYPNGETLCLGQKRDLPLSAYGFEQARMLGRYFASLPVEAVYTSPLRRARQTAQAIAGADRPLIALDDLIELDGGEWDGLSFAELRARYPQHFGSGVSGPPGGETDEQGLARAYAALEHVLARTKRCAVIVAHGTINRLLLCALSGLPLGEKKRMRQGLGAVSVVTATDGVLRVGEVNLLPETLAGR